MTNELRWPNSKSSISLRLEPPVMVDVTSRQRLFAQLDAGRRRSCAWVTASAGYGKTSLLASYVATREVSCLWYALRPADSDPMRFFQRLTAAIKSRQAALELPDISVINLADPESFSEVFFTALTGNELNIVLDDYHHLAVDSAVHQFLIPGLERLAKGQWLVASRAAPPAPLTRLVANSVIEVVATEDLKFTVQETADLLSMRHLANDTVSDAQQLRALSEGWVAGLVLLIKHQQIGLPHSTSEGLVFGYFMQEIVSQVDAETRRFLIVCALISDITPAIAVALTGCVDSGQRLESIARSYAFVKCSQSDPPVYRFHALFRDVLLEMGRTELGLDALTEHKQQAYQCLVEHHRLDDAVEVLVDLEDWAELIGLIGTQAEALLSNGQVHTLKSWIQHVPRAVAMEVTWLAFWEALCDLPFTPAKTRQRLEQILERFKGENNPAGIYLTWSFIVESYWFEINELQPLNHWLSELEQLQEEYPLPEALPIKARVLYGCYIIASLLLITEKQDALEEQMMGLLGSDLPAEQKVAYASMMMFHAAQTRGGRERSIDIRVLIQKILATEQVSPMCRCSWYLNDCLCDFSFGDAPFSLSLSLAEARDIAERHGFKAWRLTLQVFSCQGLCMQGQGHEAQRILSALVASQHKAGRHHVGHYLFVSAWCKLLNGQLDEAMDCAEEVLEISLRLAPTFRALSWLAIARVALARGERGKVLMSLAHTRRISRKIGYQQVESAAQLLLAAYAFSTQRYQRGHKILRHAFAIARAQGYRHFYLQTPETLAQLCASALNSDIESDYAKTLIRANQLTAPDDLICDDWPWPVRIRALGPLSIEIHGESLVFQGKAQAKPLAMLKALIAEECQPVIAESVANALWPKADGEQAKANIKTTLRRLRKLLGHEAVILQEGCLQLNPATCWIDTVAFRRQLDTTRTARIPTDVLEDSLCLYCGPLLQDEETSDRATHLRLELDSFYQKGVQDLAQRLMDGNHPSRAIDWLLRGIELCSLSDSLYKTLLQLYVRLNKRTDAVNLFVCYRDRLRNELDLEPDDEMKRIMGS